MKNKIAFFLLLLAAFYTGCTEKPNTQVGNNLVDPSIQIAVFDTMFTSISDTTYQGTVIPGTGSSNLVGRTSAGEDVVTMLNFQTSPRSFDSLDGAVIDTANISLTVNYRWNVTAIPVRLDMYEILQPWNYLTFSSDSASSNTLGPHILASYSDSMNYSRTVISTPIDTTTVRKMINSYLHPDSTAFYGFALRAAANTTPGIAGFITFTANSVLSPTLTIIYSRNGKKDSLKINYGFDTFYSQYTTPPVMTPIEVQGCFGIRSNIKFDLSSLNNKPVINNAVLELTLNKSQSQIEGYSPDTIAVYIRSSDSNLDNIYTSTQWSAYGAKKDSSQTTIVYQCKVTPFVQQWVNNVIVNNGFNIRWAAENSSADKAIFYSSTEADRTKRPALKIVYSKK